MVRQCAFRNCTNKPYRWTPQSFHQFPVRDPERTQMWLVAAGLDINTPAETVRKRSICSDHFRPDDFEKPRNLKSNKSLKTNAVPSVFSDARTATDEQVQDTSEEIENPSGHVGSTGIQVNVPDTCTMEKPTLQYIVDEEAILQLMKNCPICNRKCRCNRYPFGPYLRVYQSCYFCHFQRKWASQPEAKNMDPRNVGNKQPKKKRQPKDNVSVNAKTQPSQLHQMSSSESLDPLQTGGAQC